MVVCQGQTNLGNKVSNFKSHDTAPKSTYTRIRRQTGQIRLFWGNFGTHRGYILMQEHAGSHMVFCQGQANLRNKVEQFEIS